MEFRQAEVVVVNPKHASRPQRMVVDQASLIGRDFDVAVSEGSGEVSERDGRRRLENVIRLPGTRTRQILLRAIFEEAVTSDPI